MDLYFDLNRGHFVTANGTSDQVTALRMKRGDTVQIVLRFCRGIVVTELATGAAGQLGVKEVGDYDGDFVAAAPSWVKAGTGSATTYTFELNLDTEELDDLLGVGAPADVASVELNFELEFTVGDTVTSSNTVLLTVDNDVIRGSESGPTDITGGTPVNGVVATGSLEIFGNPIAGDTVTVGPVTYAFNTGTLTLANEVFVGASAAISLANLAYAIATGASGSGGTVGPGTVAHPTVTASSTGTVLTATARTAGADANSIATTELLNGSWEDPTLTGGVTATAGFLGSMQVDTSFLYVVCAVTSGVPTWKKIALSTL